MDPDANIRHDDLHKEPSPSVHHKYTSSALVTVIECLAGEMFPAWKQIIGDGCAGEKGVRELR